MKLLIVSMIALSIGSTVFAEVSPQGQAQTRTPAQTPAQNPEKSITCDVETFLAAVGGLMPAQTFKMTAAVQNPKQKVVEKCTAEVRGELRLMLCATTADFDGGYTAGLLVSSASKPSLGYELLSGVVMATQKNAKYLIWVNGTPARVLRSVSDQLAIGNIDAPTDLDGDSTALDNAIAKGVDAGVLKVDEPVLFILRDCLHK